MTTRDQRQRTLDEAQDALHAAMLSGDTASLHDLLFEGLSFEVPDGSIVGRAADLAAHASGATRFDLFTETSRATVEHDGHGRTLSEVDLIVTDHGRRVEARVAYLRFWSIIDGRWQVIAGQVAPTG
jgi:hypothetical protein